MVGTCYVLVCICRYGCIADPFLLVSMKNKSIYIHNNNYIDDMGCDIRDTGRTIRAVDMLASLLTQGLKPDLYFLSHIITKPHKANISHRAQVDVQAYRS